MFRLTPFGSSHTPLTAPPYTGAGHTSLRQHSDYQHWQGEYYSSNSSVQYSWARSFIDEIGPQLQGNILDIGCGPGKITSEVARSHPESRVVGLDLSPTMIETARKLYSSEQYQNLCFIRQDAEHIHLDGKFDAALSFSALHWIRDKKSLLQSIAEVLNPNGKIFLFFAPQSDEDDRLDRSTHTASCLSRWEHYLTKENPNQYYLIYPTEFAKILSESHFKLCHMQEVRTHSIFVNPEEFIQWMKGWLPHLKLLPEEEHEAFLAAVVEDYVKKHPIDANNHIHYYDYMLKVIAEKSE